jgi:DNA-directed RNA polymerase specialized sigma24 family protein
LTPDQPERVIRADGWSYRVIAAKLVVDEGTVRYWLGLVRCGTCRT